MSTIRRATLSDLERLLELLAELHGARPRPVSEDDCAVLDQILADDSRCIFLAQDGHGTVVGTVDVVAVSNLSRERRPWAIVENLVVEASHRRKGFGRLLMSSAINFAVDAGCYKVQLISNDKRREAHSLYDDLGFTVPVRGYRQYFFGV